MVFEKIVADLLNRFLGDYVENLDRKQLKLGIWGGDVSLKNLEVKASALQDLDLPVQVTCGHLGHLHLKIPWKNMYTAPVIATIEELFVVVIPYLAISYDAEKEEKALQQAKQAELQRIEEAKAKQKKDEKEDKKDTFTEKLVTQIIKNLQVKIIDIHIRYEDTVSDRHNPFSFGITLHNLFFETTNDKWIPTIIQEQVSIIHKLVTLDSLAFYWTCNTKLISKMSPEERQIELKKAIATSAYKPPHIAYMLGPIHSSAQLQLNSHPENDNFKVPKVWLNVVMEEIAVGLSKNQYRDLMKLLEGFDRLTVATLYRKYRPNVPHEGHAKEWWHFAINAILEEEVRRKKRNWSWEHMQKHRTCCKHYKELYVLKLLGKKISSDQHNEITDCEKQLDLFNITVTRKQAELEHLRKSKSPETKKVQSWGGWVGSWFSGSTNLEPQDDESAGKKIIKQFEEAMTEEEKSKLYEAIGYQDQSDATDYPKEFVENKLMFLLRNLTIMLSDDTRRESQVLKMDLTVVSSNIEQRPSAGAISVEAKINSLIVGGVPHKGDIPIMVTSQESEEKHLDLLTVAFETNPLDGSCDSRVNIQAQPLEVIFNAVTVNNLVELFTPPEQVDLQQLQATALLKLEEMKEMSAFGLQYAIEQHKYLDLKVDMKPVFLIIPENGKFRKDIYLIVMSLGRFRMNSAKRDPHSPTVRSMVKAGSTEEEVMSTMMENAYDKYHIQIENMEILLASPDDRWRKAVGRPASLNTPSLHLLKPLSLNVDLHKAIITVDPRMPIMKVAAELSSLNINISDDQLLHLIKIATGIPTPKTEPKPSINAQMKKSGTKTSVLPAAREANSAHVKVVNQVKREAMQTFKSVSSDSDDADYIVDKVTVQKTDLEVKFDIKELIVSLSYSHKKKISNVRFVIDRLGTLLTMRTFDMSCDMYLGGILLENSAYYLKTGQPLKLISTSVNESDEDLLTIKYLQADKKGPDFVKKYNSTLQFITIDFRDIYVLLHQEAIISLMELSNYLIEKMNSFQDTESLNSYRKESIFSTAEVHNLKQHNNHEPGKHIHKRRKKEVSIIDMEIQATLGAIGLMICSAGYDLTDIAINRMKASVKMDKRKTMFIASLDDIIITDPMEKCLYPKILMTDSEEVFHLKFMMFNDATDDENYINLNAVDMNVDVNFGRMRYIFLNKFIASLLFFLDPFSAAKEKVAEASAHAAEAAKHSMEKVYEKATRIALNVSIQAPVIIIPQSSSSKNTVIADLGTLRIMNKFEFGNKRNELGIPALLDNMTLSLENLTLSRGLVDPSTNAIVAECCLIEPVSFHITVVRNLSSTWYIEQPEMDICGKLEAICISLSQGDYTTVMSVLSENLSETQVQELPQQPLPSISQASEEQHRKPSTVIGMAPGKTETKISVTKPFPTKVFTRFKFRFVLDFVSAKFFTGATELSSLKNQHKLSDAIADVAIRTLSINAEMKSDSSINALVLLDNVTLDDSRVNRKGVTRLMERLAKPDSEKMILVKFSQTSDGSKNLDVKVCSFVLIVSLPYFMKLGEFFSQTQEQSADNIQKEIVPASNKPTDLALPSKSTVQQQQQSTSETTVISVKLESPDLVLIEDIDDPESEAIFLNNEVTAKISLMDQVKAISARVSNLTFYTASFNPERRVETTVHILNPSQIDLQCNMKPEAQAIDLLVHDLVLQISPGTVDLLTNILSTLTVEKVEVKTQEEEEIYIEEDHTDLWKPKSVSDCNFWFLEKLSGREKAIEATEADILEEEDISVTERMLFTLKKIILTIEAGKGVRTKPMLMAETSFQAQICDWTSELNIESTLSIEVSYFNERIAVWEPLLEPIETPKGHRSWELYMEITKRLPIENEELEEEPVIPLKIEIRSDDMMDLVISRACIDILTDLSEAFGQAVKKTNVSRDKHPYAAYHVYNNLGIPVCIVMNGKYEVLGDQKQYDTVVLHTDSPPVHLMIKGSKRDTEQLRISALKKQFVRDESEFNIMINTESLQIERTVSVACTNKRYFVLPQTSYPGHKWGFVVHVKSDCGSRVVKFHSIIQVHNHFTIPMDIYYMKDSDNEIAWCGMAEPNKILHVPLHAVYTKSMELFFKPKDRHQMYSITSQPFVWKVLIENPEAHKTVQCECKQTDGHSFFMNIAGNVERIYFEESLKKTVASSLFTINLYPTVRLRNLLLFPIHYSLQGVDKDFELGVAETNELWSAEIGETGIEVRLLNYLDRDWTCYQTLSETSNELSVWTFNSASTSGTVRTLELGVNTQQVGGSLVLQIYTPYCMINKTGLTLVYRNDENNIIHHPPDMEHPIMFSFKAKAFFSKKKVSIRVEDSEWSDKFSIDAIGSSGNVIAKSKLGQHYDIGVQIRMGKSGLTKMIIFSPFYLLVNNCHFDIECQEIAEGADWIMVKKGECTPFWPRGTSNAKMVVRYCKDKSNTTAAFSFKENQRTLLKLNSKKGGIQVECQVAQSSIILTFEDYIPGSATALIVNHLSEYSITFYQSGTTFNLDILPYTCSLYTWEDPLEKRLLMWKCGDVTNGTHDLVKDGVGEFSPAPNVQAYWLSFLDGMQRILIFTHDLNRAIAVDTACQAVQMEQECVVLLQGLGVSLVNNDAKVELLYMGITSTGVIWEGRKEKSKRFKALSLRECMQLETGYVRYQNELKVGKGAATIHTLEGGKLVVDFQDMKIVKPTTKFIRRSFQMGLSLEYKMSPTAYSFHAKINRLQIDNQLGDCVFPVIFAPVPPPKSVAAESAPKPFTELSVMLRQESKSKIVQVKYCSILIQEFHIKLDQGFINSMIQFFTPDQPTEVDYIKLLGLDQELCASNLKEVAAIYSSEEQKCYYDNLHFSPLKVHISFSNTGAATGDEKKPSAIHSDVLNLLLQSVGVSLTEVQDLIFKLDYFERRYTFMSTKQLTSEATSHYVKQAVKQFYVLVLGLDVIGNPAGLILGLGEGVTDLFYEPFQGAIQGPEEFVEGLELGVKSLFGHAVGGAAGAASRITGTLGKGLAALTLDADYQKKRRQNLNRRPQDAGQRFAHGGKNFVMGIYEGVSGVVTKPVEGAREGGVGGFFKGFGKGLIGVIARPTAGAVDFVSGSLDSVKKMAELHEEVKRLRPPRYIRQDGVIRPYVKKESEGSRLLQDVEKGKYSKTDVYEAHITVGVDEKSCLLVTNNRVMYITKGDVFGQWNAEWEYRWEQLKGVPTVTENGIKILLKEPHKKKMSLFGSKVAGKLVHAHDIEQCKWVVMKMKEIMASSPV